MTPIAALPLQNDYAVEILFEEIGVIIDGAKCGLYSGTAQIDQDGDITGLLLDGYQDGVRVSRYVPVPSKEHGWLNDLAKVVSEDYRGSIRDAVNEWHVSQAEDSWE